jgi:SOS response regulatory protein OraA/RecX
MGNWISDAEKTELVKVVESRFRSGTVGRDEILRAKMDLGVADAQMQAAVAEERAAIATEVAAKASVRNARYMLWSVIAAAVSAIASLASTAIAVFGHH